MHSTDVASAGARVWDVHGTGVVSAGAQVRHDAGA